MYHFRPDYKIYVCPILDYPHQSIQAAIMHMLSNNLDYVTTQSNNELITFMVVMVRCFLKLPGGC